MSTETLTSEKFSIRPTAAKKFNSAKVKEVIKSVLQNQLTGKDYKSLSIDRTLFQLSNLIVEKVTEFDFVGYKYVANVTLAENKGQGMKYKSSCTWDLDADDVATDMYITDTLICVASVHGAYFY